VAALLLAVAPVLMGAEACGPPASDGGTGVVIKREHHEARNSSLTYWIITIRRDVGGASDTGRVSETVGQRCQLGEHWPDCKHD
jgi:hypothetical protein